MHTREMVYKKYNGHCAYCGCKLKIDNFDIDHIQARIYGGDNDLSNFNPSCRRCNSSKRCLSLEEFRLACWKKLNGIPWFSSEQIAWFNKVGFDYLGLPSFSDINQLKFYFERSDNV
jgi:5-methylcytosine-specific restriction endonuclease McrA